MESGVHVEMLTWDAEDSLVVPGGRGDATLPVWSVMDSGSVVATILETMASRIQSTEPDAAIIRQFDGEACIKTAMGAERDNQNQTCPVHVVIWNSLFRLISGICQFFGRRTLREVLGS